MKLADLATGSDWIAWIVFVIGMSIIAILALIMGVLENILSAFFVYIALGIILIDVAVIIILGNTLCRK